jgi:hypothetical protein
MDEYENSARKLGVNFNHDLSVRENWEAADWLKEAWWLLCGEKQRECYRNCGANQRRMNALEHEIKLETLDRLFTSELIALGISTSPTLDSEPCQIPPIRFRPGGCTVDWDANAIQGSGRRYVSVALCRSTPETSVQPLSDHMPPGVTKGRGGRPDTYGFAAEVLRDLHRIEANRQLSAEKLHPTFAAAVEMRFPPSEYQMRPPSLRTLRNHLRRYRQDTAQTGNN